MMDRGFHGNALHVLRDLLAKAATIRNPEQRTPLEQDIAGRIAVIEESERSGRPLADEFMETSAMLPWRVRAALELDMHYQPSRVHRGLRGDAATR